MTKVSLEKDNTYIIIGLFAPVLFYLYGNISIILILIYYAYNSKEKFKIKKRCIKITAKTISIFIPIIFLLSIISKFILFEFKEQKVVLDLKENKINELYISFFIICIIAPIFEEIVFRGFFYKAIKRFVPYVLSSIIVAFIFALIHNNILSFTILFVVSLLFTWIYERTSSIIYPILAHSTFNLLMLTLILLENHG